MNLRRIIITKSDGDRIEKVVDIDKTTHIDGIPILDSFAEAMRKATIKGRLGINMTPEEKKKECEDILARRKERLGIK